MRSNGPDTATHRLETRNRLESIHTLVVGDGSTPGLCEQVRSLQVEQSHLRSDIRQLTKRTESFDAKLDTLLAAASERPRKRKSIFAIPKLRRSLFVLGSLGAIVAEAIHASFGDGWSHAVAAACTGVAAFALRWPTDVTKAEADEREQRARMSSAPPSS